MKTMNYCKTAMSMVAKVMTVNPTDAASNNTINNLSSITGPKTIKTGIMKKSLLFLKAAAVCFFLSFGQTATASDMYDILRKGQRVVSLLETLDEEIVRSEYDLIHKNSPKTIYRTLSSDYTYTITGFASEDRIADLDIMVYKKVNGEWILDTQDVKSDATPVVSITPPYTREYKIVVKAFSWKGGNNVSCYGLIVSHD